MFHRFPKSALSIVCSTAGLLSVLTAFSSTALAVDIVPEIDASSMSAAVALLLGGTMLFKHRQN